MMMNFIFSLKLPFFFLLLTISHVVFAQSTDGFNRKQASIDAANKGIPATDIEGYVNYLQNDYLSHKNKEQKNAPNIRNARTLDVNGAGSFLNKVQLPGTQNVYCPNAGFEQLSFANWTGGYGTVSPGLVGAPYPVYNQTSPTIVNPAGNDASLINTLNYHTILTTPATNSVYPNCIGYDSIACKIIGGQTVSEIPLVNPSGGPASVRLNGASANYRASKLAYSMTLNPNNKSFTVSYAIVLEDGAHTANDQSYFSVRITDQNGNLVPGCSIYTVTVNSNVLNPSSPYYDSLWTASAISANAYYRKWQTFNFDFTSYPAITSVNVEFYVGGCSLSGHFGYAYVDAQCGIGGAVASFCSGSTTAVLNAPDGYATYQWTGPAGPISSTDGGNTATATITPVTAGQVFTCNVTSPGACTSVFQTTVTVTTLSITGINSVPSCAVGSNGTADVSATGSSMGYSYQWLNGSGTPTSSSQTATGLSPGTYSVVVSSPSCGSNSATVTVGQLPANFSTSATSFCGTVAQINSAGNGSAYSWYEANPISLIAGATSSSLTVTNAVNNDQYILCYINVNGCKDSIHYTLTETPAGSVYVSPVKSICPGNSNSYAVIHLQTTAPPVYSYTVTGPSGYSSVLNATTLLKDSVSILSIGSYSVLVSDGACLYNTTFTVNPLVYDFMVTPATSTICSNSGTVLAVDFVNAASPSGCGLATHGDCSWPNQVTVGAGTLNNMSSTYPSVYGNWFKNTRHQLLYTAAELQSAGILPGKLSSLSFLINSIPAGYIGTIPGLRISMKCTSVDSLTTTFDNTGLVQVYYASYFHPVTGWNIHPFATPYEWDGISNLLIDVCYSLNTASFVSFNPIMAASGTPVSQCSYAFSNVNPLCSSTNPATPSLSRPVLKFENCGTPDPASFSYTWIPTTGLSSSNTYSTIAAPLVQTIYSVVINPIGQTNCSQFQTATVTLGSSPSLSVNSVTLCEGNSGVLMAQGAASYSWSPPTGLNTVSSSTVTASPMVSTNYTVTGSLSGCSSAVTASVSVKPLAHALISASTLSVSTFGQPIVLTASGGSIFNWPGHNSSAAQLVVSPIQNSTYCVEVSDANTCPDTACVLIYADFKSTLEFPNVFTPNGDGANDSFYFPATNIKAFQVTIFNRWGVKLFESSDVAQGWDGNINGTKASDGVYSYIIKATGIDDVLYEKAGYVTLIR